jgi:hypothetical protein
LWVSVEYFKILHWLDAWLDRVERKLGGDGDEHPPKRRGLPHFTPPVYRAKPSGLVEVKGVKLPPFGFGATLVAIQNTGELPPGSDYRFQVQQRVDGRVVGGGTYVVRIVGEPKLPPPIVAPSHRIDPKTQRLSAEAPEDLENIPPWMEGAVEERAEQSSKFPREIPPKIG